LDGHRIHVRPELERDKARFERRLQAELAERDAYFESLQQQLASISYVI
jgi:hypothetical protein